MTKGLTMAELIIALMIVAIVIIVTVPTIFADITRNDKVLLKSAYTKLLPSVINDILPTLNPLNNSFCNEFVKRVNVVGPHNCMTSTVPDVPNFTTSNGMRWYGFSATNFNPTNPIAIKIDINGKKRGLNTDNTANNKRDIMKINIYHNGDLSVDSGSLEEKYLGNDL